MTVSTREGLGRGRFRGADGSGVGVGGGPMEAAPGEVGSVGGGGGRRTTTSPARGGRSVSRRDLGSLTLATTLSTRWKGGNAYTSR